jgi:kynurenine formamidase
MATLTTAQFRALYAELRESLPWTPEDRRGALNYLTASEVLAAMSEVRVGRHVSLASPVSNDPAPDNPDPAVHRMTGPPDGPASDGVSFATDRIEMNVHGDKDSHIDALCHVIFDGRLYNRVSADPDAAGIRELSIGVACDGIVGRGVLLDVPRARGTAWLEPGERVTIRDLLAAEREQDVQVGQGDLLFVRVGHQLRRDEQGPWNVAQERAGLHPEVLPWLAERKVAVLGSDSNSDAAPSAVEGVDFPVHVLAVNALGMHLLDYLQFEDLVSLCEAVRRWSFLCVIAPLWLPRGTGSPVNPIAIL